MKGMRILGLLLIIVGIGLYLCADYIAEQVSQGKGQISQAQKQVDQANSLFSISPYTKEVGKMATDSAQEKIEAGKEQVSKYEGIAQGLHTGGIVVFAVGAGLFIFSFFGKRRS